MVEKLGIDRSKVPQLCDLLYKNYGTTMAGLRVFFLKNDGLIFFPCSISYFVLWYFCAGHWLLIQL